MHFSKHFTLGYFLGVVTSITFFCFINSTSNINYNDYSENCEENITEEIARSDGKLLEHTLPKETNNPNKDFVISVMKCNNKTALKEYKRRGSFWVFYNYIKAEKEFGCAQSITLTTPADFRFLDNLSNLVKVWRGPISVAVHSPGDDFQTTLKSIAYLRNCDNRSSLIRGLVTFHVFFEEDHLPSTYKTGGPLANAYNDTYDCDLGFITVPDANMYKKEHNLTYPINVGRNIARETALTHFIFASDIELFPTPNFIDNFFKMIVKYKGNFSPSQQRVFVLPVFEIEADQAIPENKTKLQEMIKEKKAIMFHEKLCSLCHAVIEYDRWIKKPETSDVEIFTIGKRQGKQKYWEPFYIGTNADPFFDERITWEGQSNKMTQAYNMCLIDYDFVILDNAFLTHKPGIKREKSQLTEHAGLVGKTNSFIRKTLKNELISIFGDNKECAI